jgi:hypothetical protein
MFGVFAVMSRSSYLENHNILEPESRADWINLMSITLLLGPIRLAGELPMKLFLLPKRYRMRALGTSVILTFLSLIYSILTARAGNSSGISWWVPFITLLSLVGIGYYSVLEYKLPYKVLSEEERDLPRFGKLIEDTSAEVEKSEEPVVEESRESEDDLAKSIMVSTIAASIDFNDPLNMYIDNLEDLDDLGVTPESYHVNTTTRNLSSIVHSPHFDDGKSINLVAMFGLGDTSDHEVEEIEESVEIQEI